MIDIIYKYFDRYCDSKDDITSNGHLGNTHYFVLNSKFGFKLKFGYEIIGGYTTLDIIGIEGYQKIQSSKNFQKRQNRFLRRKYGFFKSVFSSKIFEGYIEFFSDYLDEVLQGMND